MGVSHWAFAVALVTLLIEGGNTTYLIIIDITNSGEGNKLLFLWSENGLLHILVRWSSCTVPRQSDEASDLPFLLSNPVLHCTSGSYYTFRQWLSTESNSSQEITKHARYRSYTIYINYCGNVSIIYFQILISIFIIYSGKSQQKWTYCLSN